MNANGSKGVDIEFEGSVKRGGYPSYKNIGFHSPPGIVVVPLDFICPAIQK
jgi:hypothetical protein